MSENRVQSYVFGKFRLDVENHQLLKDENPVSLTQKSFEVLLFLLENRGRILKKEHLLDTLWEGNYVEEANLTQHIYMLRKALKEEGVNDVYIETIPKNGYRFVADVVEESSNTNGHLPLDLHNQTEYKKTEEKGYKTVKSGEVEQYSEENDKGQKDNQSYKATYIAIGSLLALGTILIGYFIYTNQNNSISSSALNTKSIAVLPFKQIDKEKNEKLGIGIADVLIARLANIEEVNVRPTTSIIRFADTANNDLFDIGNKLDVDYVIAGTIQRDEKLIRVTTQLYEVEKKRQVWTEKFDEEYTDIFTLQDKISERIAQKLLANLKTNLSTLPYKQYTKSAEAYKAYSMGLSFWSMHTKTGFENALVHFKKAIEKDPEFANAYAYLADTYGHTNHLSSVINPVEAKKKGKEAAEKALKIDPQNAPAMAALALIYANQDKQTEAFELMKKSIKLKPNDAHSRHRISWMYANKGNIDKAVEEMRIAQKLDPQSSYINLFYGEILLLARQPDKALEYFDKVLEIEPDSFSAKWRKIEAYEEKKQFDLAEEQLEELVTRYGKFQSYPITLSRLYAKNNKRAEAESLLKDALKLDKEQRDEHLIAFAEIALGKNEAAVKRLTEIINSTEDNIYRVKYEPKLDPIRTNPKFEEVLKNKELAQGW